MFGCRFTFIYLFHFYIIWMMMIMMNIATWTMIGNDFRTMFADVSYTFIDECILILKLIKDIICLLSFFLFVCFKPHFVPNHVSNFVDDIRVHKCRSSVWCCVVWVDWSPTCGPIPNYCSLMMMMILICAIDWSMFAIVDQPQCRFQYVQFRHYMFNLLYWFIVVL